MAVTLSNLNISIQNSKQKTQNGIWECYTCHIIFGFFVTGWIKHSLKLASLGVDRYVYLVASLLVRFL